MGFISLVVAVLAIFIAISRKDGIIALNNKIEELERRLSSLEFSSKSTAPAPEAPAQPEEAPQPEPIAAPQPETAAQPSYAQAEAHTPPSQEIIIISSPETQEPSAGEPVQQTEPLFKLPQINWETFTGAKLFSWIGAVALFFGVAFFVKYSIDNALLSPALRIILSLSGGGICIALGLFIKNKDYKTTAVTLCSAGTAILYASVFAAQYFYGFISVQSAFLFMGLISIAGYALAMHLNSKAAAVLSAAMGFALPFINALPFEKQFLADGFIFILASGGAAVAVKKNWDLLIKLCAICTSAIIISAAWDVQYAALGALLVLNTADFKSEKSAWRNWLIGLTYTSVLFWCFRNAALGENVLLLVLAVFAAFYFVLAKIKHMPAHIVAMTLPSLSILYVYLSFRPDMFLVLKCSAFMLAMYGAAVYFTLKQADSKGQYLYLPLGAAFASALSWNVQHLNLELLPLSAAWCAVAVLIPFVTMLLTRLGENKKTKDVVIYYTLISMLIPIYILKTLGGGHLGFGLGFGLAGIINVCLLFSAFDDKKNYGSNLLSFTAAATFLAEITWAAWHFKEYNPYFVLGVFAFFSVLYAGLAFALRKSETKEQDGGTGIFILASMLCATYMTNVVAQSTQIVFGSFGFLFMSTVLLVSLVYNRKKQGALIAGAAIATFLILAVWLAGSGASIYVKAGIILPFVLLYTTVPLLKGIKEPAAKVFSSIFVMLSAIFVLALANKDFNIVTGLMLFINGALALLYFKDSVHHNIQFRITGVLAFIFSLVLLFLGRSPGPCLLFFILLFMINGLTDYLKYKEKDNTIAYSIHTAALFILFFLSAKVALGWVYLALMSIAFIYFNLKTNRQIASIIAFIGAMFVLSALPSANPKLGLVYIFGMTVLYMLPALLSKAEKKNIWHGVALSSGVCGYGMMFATALNHVLWPAWQGAWALLWAVVFCAMGLAAKNRIYNFISAALIIAAVPIQFNGHLVTIFWALEGVAFMLYGLVQKQKLTRILGSALLLFVTFKLFFIDLWHLGGLYRVGAFMGTAVMLIAVSFFYQKFIKDN